MDRTWWIGWLDFDYSLEQMRSLSPLAVTAVLAVGALIARDMETAKTLIEEAKELTRDALWPMDSQQSSTRNIMDLRGVLIVGTFVDFTLCGAVVQ